MKKRILILILVLNQFAFAQNSPWDEEYPFINIECSNGDVFEINLLDALNPVFLDSIYSLCGESDVDDDWTGPDWDDDFWDFDSTDVDNPWDNCEECPDFEPENPEDYILDCNGDEAPGSWLGDGFCDNWGGANFNCEEFDFDQGDCDDIEDENEDDWEGGFDCINTNPEAFEVYMSCMNGDEEACLYLEEICAEEEEEIEDDWDEDSVIEIECINGEVYEFSIFDVLDSSFEEMITSLCGEEGIDDDWTGPDWDDDFWDFDSTDVDNPWDNCEECPDFEPENPEDYILDCNGDEAPGSWLGDGFCDNWGGANFNCEEFDFDQGDCDDIEDENEDDWEGGFDCINTNPEAFEVYMSCMSGDEEACLYLEEICAEEEEDNEDDWDEEEDEEDNCYNEVFPGMDDIDMNTLFGGIEMTYQDIIFIVESSESTISILDENGINYVPEEVEGYLIFGPFTLEDIYTFFIEGLDDLEIDWGMFRPLNSEIISQGTYNTDNNSLPEIFNFSAMSIEDLDQELIIYSTDYYDLMGRKVLEPKPNSIYIELKSTNLGPLKEVKYYCN